ncbi:transporter substrate-binding domain-containing protein [Salidesulfovibrio brasiliensis]|uniref:transporter substrate-binding domain-containing protein n=1 Tax=Salidesulfovibrio brasiliensis TaxID=221711 RepID=UPI0009F974C0|nr:transporter substrate-binding domain-containing protein [Salidesulfovibrio brasiliensis]
MRRALTLILTLVILCPAAQAQADVEQQALVVTHAKAMPPLSFIGEDGRPQGLVIDLWKEWSSATGIPVSFHLVEWKDTFKLLDSGAADVIGALFFTPERAMKLDYAGAFMRYSASYFAGVDMDIDSPETEEREPIAVIRGDFAAQYLRDNHRTKNIKYFNNGDELIESLRTGSTMFFIMDTALAHWKLRNAGLDERFAPIGLAYERELHAATKRGRNDIISLINVGMRKIPPEEKAAIIQRWIPERRETDFGYWEITGAVAALLIIGIISAMLVSTTRRFK